LIHLYILQVRHFVEHVNVSLLRRPNAIVSFQFIAWLIISLATVKEKKKKKPDLFRFISRLNKEKNELADLFGYTVSLAIIPPKCSIILPRRYPDDNAGIICKIMSWKSYKLQCLSSKHIKITTTYYSFVHTLGKADENSV